jgi:saccharopine dehydrogenase-like NADP-dependent oxidoreductase
LPAKFNLPILMKKLLILGAGKSAYDLISYILKHAAEFNWQVTISDMTKLGSHFDDLSIEKADFKILDINNHDASRGLIQTQDLVVSLLPVSLHTIVAGHCLATKTHLLTPSYIQKEILALDGEVRKAGLCFLNELGLDPGIDHMSAMQLFEKLKLKGAEIKSFQSYTGGLMSAESAGNPWEYKLSWSPLGVVTAGQGTARFKENNKLKYIPYHQLFKRVRLFSIPELGDFEGYKNRDSLMYERIYGLDGIPTIIRGTLRRTGFSEAWDVLVQLGITDNSYVIDNLDTYSFADFIDIFLPEEEGSIKNRLAKFLSLDSDCEAISKVEWLGLFSDKKIGLKSATPAQVLQKRIEEVWKMEEEDKDLIVMLHLVEYTLHGKSYRLKSYMSSMGKSMHKTAMSRTVGLPMAVAAKLLLNGDFLETGVIRPVFPEIYNPLLEELKEFGINFHEDVTEL